jgi:NADH-quinone oxidoreductase subunit H
MNSVTMAGLFVTLFLGGPAGPAPIGPGWLWGSLWFFVKVLAILFMFVWFRGTLPRFRYDQLMDLGWKLLIPLALGWLVMLGTVRLTAQQGWNWAKVIVGIAVVGLVGYGLLRTAVANGHRRRLEELEEVD